jgi:hypothetical protein
MIGTIAFGQSIFFPCRRRKLLRQGRIGKAIFDSGAKAYAIRIADELSDDTEWKSAWVVIIDEQENEIARVVIA